MGYRDDLAAAQARADAAERRAQDLQKRVDELEGRDGEPAPKHPAVAIPERFEVIRDGDALRIRWRWFRASEHLFLIVFCAIWDGVVMPTYVVAILERQWGLMLFMSGHLAVGIGLTYGLLAGLFNRTTITARPDTLEIRHGPVRWRGNRVLGRRDVRQLMVREREQKDDSVYDLCVLVPGDKELTLIKKLAERAQADYLEHELERYFRIRDRPVVGEAD